jgi:hypothetical protein
MPGKRYLSQARKQGEGIGHETGEGPGNRSLQWKKLAIAYASKGPMLLDDWLADLAVSEFNKALRTKRRSNA